MKSLLTYFKGAIHELRNVSWPTQRQAIRLSIITIGFVIAGAVVFGLFDAIVNAILFSLV